MRQDLRPLLEPASICFIGASDNPGRIGGMPLSLLTRYGYQGDVYPINPKYTEVFGLPCYPDVESLPQTPDLAVLAIGAPDVLPMLQRCHSRGIRAAVVYAAGFAEEGEAGRALQAGIEAFAQSSGMAVAGPNCMGLANLNTQAHTAFASVFNAVPMQQGRGAVSLLTQSGNVCAALYALVRELGLSVSQFINTGNEACVEFAEYLEYLADDEDTEVVLGYVEQLRNGPRFVDACRRLARNDKVLIALKAGTTSKGAAAVQSHTSALAGDQRVYRSVFEKVGVIEAHDFAQMAQLAMLARLRHREAGRRVAVVTMSGALGAILADRFIESGLELPDLPAHVQAVLREGIPDYGMVGNPVDVTGNVVNNPGFVRNVLEALATSPALDAVVIYAPGYMLDRMADSLVEVARAHARFFAAIDTGRAACRDTLREAGVAVFDDLGRAVAALGPFLSWQARRRAAMPAALEGNADASKGVSGCAAEGGPAAYAATEASNRDPAAVASGSQGADEACVPGKTASGLALDIDIGLAGPLNEAQALGFLAAHGVPVMQARIAASAEEAVAHARAAGFPVVLKVLSADIAHKTEVGGVALKLADEAAVARAYEDIMRSVREKAPRAHVQGVLVQAMEAPGVELIVGARRDPVFGPMLTVGLGGVLTELYQDSAHALLPLEAGEAEALLRRLVAFPLLDGYRNAPRADIAAVARAVEAVGRAMAAAPASVAEIEVNPLLARVRGRGAVALDALILGGDARAAHAPNNS